MKLMTVLQPCLSRGINSSLFYVVFVLAAAELATFPHPLWRILIMGGMHAGILWYVNKNGMWCRDTWVLD